MFKARRYSVAYTENGYSINTEVLNRVDTEDVKIQIQRYTFNVPTDVFRK
jgi:hypothetical protein